LCQAGERRAEGEDFAVSTARLALQPQHVEDALAAVQRVLDDWGARSAFVPLWLRTAANSLGGADEAELVVEFDADARLLSFDAFVGTRRVYGADDWLG
jgi:hypothetical protein